MKIPLPISTTIAHNLAVLEDATAQQDQRAAAELVTQVAEAIVAVVQRPAPRPEWTMAVYMQDNFGTPESQE